MVRMYANENFPQEVVERLTTLGHDVLTTHQARQSNQKIPDEDVLAFVLAERRIILAFNRKDFFRLHRLSRQHFGIIACTEDTAFEALADRIHEAIKALDGKLDGQLVRVNRPNLNQKKA